MINGLKVGQAIRRHRIDRNWTQRDLADRLSMSVPAVSKIEMGITDINFSRLEQIAELFDYSIKQLLSYEKPEVIEPMIFEVEAKIVERDQEICDLQWKIIELYDQLRDLSDY